LASLAGHGPKSNGFGRFCCAVKDRSIRLLVAGDHVRVVTEEGTLLRELTLDPARDYQRIGGRTLVHDVVRHVSAMS
jgi:hypothetical protein